MLPKGVNVPKIISRGEKMPKILFKWENMPNMSEDSLREIMPNKLRRENILSGYEGIYAKICQKGESSKREIMPNF